MKTIYIIVVKGLKKNRNTLLVLYLLSLPFCSLAQEVKLKAITQFKYNQIDSLVNATVVSLVIDTQSFVVLNTRWLVGSFYKGDEDFASHKNHFDIYIFFEKRRRFYVQRIDNYGFFIKRKVNGKEVRKFLKNSFYKMKKEVLSPKLDTSYNQKGEMIISKDMIDHQLLREMLIINSNDTLRYIYPSIFSVNKINLEMYKYKFFSCIDKISTLASRRKWKRDHIILGYESEIW